ncbi:CoA-binding protein [Actinopolymorpha alba]|uniref:CoA-binding protein n=1 Tax=Actinopolymorpha alba TaxID=533267 RepID=UPI00035C8F40|nr:CoA-binding protein [Actinopolymorpha alba]
MTRPDPILEAATSVVVHDWPTRDVPETLTRAGYAVTVYGGPEPDDIFVSELRDGEVTITRTGQPPERADLVYVFRPLAELPGIVAAAKELGATTIWRQSGLLSSGESDPRGCWTPEEESREARRIVESAGLTYVEDPYIADAVRQRATQR